MYSKNKITKGTLKVNNSSVGETIEQKMRRVLKSGEPIEEGAPAIFTDPEGGVPPLTNVRTDRFDLALDAIESTEKHEIAKTDGAAEVKEAEEKPKKGNKSKDSETKPAKPKE